METRVTTLTVLPEGEPIFSERAYTVCIADEVVGEYVEVKQQIDGACIAIDPSEWPALKEAIERMLGECRS